MKLHHPSIPDRRGPTDGSSPNRHGHRSRSYNDKSDNDDDDDDDDDDDVMMRMILKYNNP